MNLIIRSGISARLRIKNKSISGNQVTDSKECEDNNLNVAHTVDAESGKVHFKLSLSDLCKEYKAVEAPVVQEAIVEEVFTEQNCKSTSENQPGKSSVEKMSKGYKSGLDNLEKMKQEALAAANAEEALRLDCLKDDLIALHKKISSLTKGSKK